MATRFVLAVVGLLLAGCSTLEPRSNRALQIANAIPVYEVNALHAGVGNSDHFIVLASFSGGGARAAAFGLGVLDGMSEVEAGASTLYSELDVVSGVSGGSILAAFVAMDPQQARSRFQPEVLEARLERAMYGRVLLSPRTMLRLSSPFYSRTDVFQELLDEKVYGGLRFGDLARRGTTPYLAIHATELVSGKAFSFDAARFRESCADLNDFPVSRAVAASSALPVLFAPLSFKDFGKNCPPGSEPTRVRRHLHLVDGGLADNLALLSLSRLAEADQQSRASGASANPVHDEIVVISVDADTGPDRSTYFTAATPGIRTTLRQTGSVLVRLRTYDAEREFDATVNAYRSELAVSGSKTRLRHVRVRLRDVAQQLDPRLIQLPMTLDLSPEHIRGLREAGRVAFHRAWTRSEQRSAQR